MTKRSTTQPVSETVYEILLSLADGERHGYGILLEVEERTAGRVEIRPGSLYRAIHRLLQEGLVEESEERPDPAIDDQRRRYYRITEAGREVVRQEARRMARAVESAVAKNVIGQG